MKKCPYCAEEIQDAATKCKHCGEMLKESNVSGEGPNKRKSKKSLRVLLGVVFILGGVLICVGLDAGFLPGAINFSSFLGAKDISVVKNGQFTQYPNETIGEAFSDFFSSPSWKSFTTAEGINVVEFSGKAMFQDVPVKVKLQFTLNKDKTSFEVTYYSLNDVPQNLLMLSGMIKSVYEN